MSNTIVDMPKVTQMLDAGWRVMLFKNHLTSYSAEAIHPEQAVMDRTRARLIGDHREKGATEHIRSNAEEFVDDFHYDGDHLLTDDFTPEQALTRLAYKIGGEII